MKFEFSKEMQELVDKYANDSLLSEYEKRVTFESFADMKRKLIQGVYHKDGKRIATNGILLLAVKESYLPEFEGVRTSTVCNISDEDKTSFVSWEKVIPEVESSQVEVFTDDDLSQIEKLAIVSQMANNEMCFKGCKTRIKIGENIFNAKYIFLACAMAKRFNLYNVFFNKDKKCLRIFGDRGDILVMALSYDEGNDYFDFSNSTKQPLQIEKAEFPFLLERDKREPLKIKVEKIIQPTDCPMSESDCTDCPYNQYYDEFSEEVTCSYGEE